jgi:DNA invertase Pin-like site-specific DNA recombinase
MERARAEGKDLGRPKVIVDRERIVELRRQGLAFWEIGDRLGISKSSVGRILVEYPAAS